MKKSCSDESGSNAAINARRTDNNNQENNGKVKYTFFLLFIFT